MRRGRNARPVSISFSGLTSVLLNNNYPTARPQSSILHPHISTTGFSAISSIYQLGTQLPTISIYSQPFPPPHSRHGAKPDCGVHTDHDVFPPCFPVPLLAQTHLFPRPRAPPCLRLKQHPISSRLPPIPSHPGLIILRPCFCHQTHSRTV